VFAQTTAREWTTHDSISLVVVVGGLIGAVVVLGVILLALRGRLLAKDAEAAGAGSLLEHLREMRDRGEISQVEYDAARKTAVRRISEESPGVAPGADRGARRGAPAVDRARTKKPDDPLVARPGFDLTGEALPKPDIPGSDLPPGFGDLGESGPNKGKGQGLGPQ
jgi:hypothetical protein